MNGYRTPTRERSSDTYVCGRCGIVRTTGGGRSTRYCRDCIDVDKTLTERR